MKGTEGKTELKERFVELRAEGRSYADIAAALGVSKPTLIAWGRELRKEVANARTLRLDALFEQYAIAKAKRIEVFGKRLEAILTELDKRDLSDVATGQLLKLALDYLSKMKAEEDDLVYQGEERDPMMAVCEAMTTTDTWKL
ncbi:MAG TPA: helix-turn-helix domain-containing protein [Myxococcota bacterium]|nr:helix-turn-helix domain-containing protein [Myxococcota bacterium]